MLLTIDVGNTNINFAVYDKDEEKVFYSLTTKIARTSDEFLVWIANLMGANGLKGSDIEGSIIASVVPGVNDALSKAVTTLTGRPPMQVGPGLKTGIRIKLANPKEVGADRIVDLVAVNELYGGPAMVIDYGTAITYDLLEADGTFRYGLTCPGIRISANALWNDTAKLPEIEIKLPESILANDTISSMQAGLLYGCIGQTEYIIRRVKEEAGLSQMKVIATGGLGQIIADATDMIDVYDRKLTMKGLLAIYKKNV